MAIKVLILKYHMIKLLLTWVNLMVKIVCELLEKELEDLEHIDLWRKQKLNDKYQVLKVGHSLNVVSL